MKTACFLQVEPTFWRHNPDTLTRIKVRRVTTKFPRDPLPGCVIVKLNLDIADAAFAPLRPVADVTIPVEHTQAVTVETEPLEVPT